MYKRKSLKNKSLRKSNKLRKTSKSRRLFGGNLTKAEKQSQEITRILSFPQTDYYNILGVSQGSDESEIRNVYRKLALVIHPDKCKLENCDEAFKRMSNAYDKILSNKKETTPPSSPPHANKKTKSSSNKFSSSKGDSSGDEEDIFDFIRKFNDKYNKRFEDRFEYMKKKRETYEASIPPEKKELFSKKKK